MPRRHREPFTEEQRGMLRAQALANLHELQRKLERSLKRRDPAPRYLTSVRNRNRLNHSLDLLQQAGEEVPPWLYHHGPLYPGALRGTRTGRPLDAVSLASLLGKIREARELFDPETEGLLSHPESP